MINEEDFEKLTGNLTEEKVNAFVKIYKDKLVHFYLIYESNFCVTEIKTFEPGELEIPTRSSDIGDLMVVFINKKVAESLIEGGFRIGSVKLSEAISIAETTKTIDGIFFQGTHSWFAVPKSDLSGTESAK